MSSSSSARIIRWTLRARGSFASIPRPPYSRLTAYTNLVNDLVNNACPGLRGHLALPPPCNPKSLRLIDPGTRQKTPGQVQLSLAEFTSDSLPGGIWLIWGAALKDWP